MLIPLQRWKLASMSLLNSGFGAVQHGACPWLCNSADIYEIWFSVLRNYSSLPRQPIMCVATYAFYRCSSSLFPHSKQLLIKTQPFRRRIQMSPSMLRFELRHLSGSKVSAYLDSLSTSSGRGCGDVEHRLGNVSESFKADLSMCCYGLTYAVL